MHWWQLPSPGKTGFDRFASDTLADRFIIYLPASYHNTESWPLVVFLHGSGDRGNNPAVLREQGPLTLERHAIVAAPQCLPSNRWDPAAVMRFVEHVARTYHVDRRRIYLVGYSMGGSGTWQTAAAYPELFAAIVPISGGGDPSKSTTIAHIPTWAFHGANDEVVPIKSSKRMIEAMRNAGGQPRFTVLPDEEHGICQSVCARIDLWEWLFNQSK